MARPLKKALDRAAAGGQISIVESILGALSACFPAPDKGRAEAVRALNNGTLLSTLLPTQLGCPDCAGARPLCPRLSIQDNLWCLNALPAASKATTRPPSRAPTRCPSGATSEADTGAPAGALTGFATGALTRATTRALSGAATGEALIKPPSGATREASPKGTSKALLGLDSYESLSPYSVWLEYGSATCSVVRQGLHEQPGGLIGQKVSITFHLVDLLMAPATLVLFLTTQTLISQLPCQYAQMIPGVLSIRLQDPPSFAGPCIIETDWTQASLALCLAATYRRLLA